MKTQHILVAILFSILTFAAGRWLGTQNQPTPEPYRSKQSSVGVVLDGDAAKLREALLLNDPLVRIAAVSGLLSRLGPDSLDEVRAAFDSVFLDRGDIELLLFGDWWARFDPHAAMEWSESEWRADHRLVAEQILRAWARTDPRAALVRADTGREGLKDSKSSYTQAAMHGWEEGDVPGLVEFLQMSPPSPNRQRMMAGLARRRVLRNGIDEAFQWVPSLPDGGDRLFKLNLMRRVASAAVRIDAEAAAKWVSSLQGGPYFASLPQRVAIPWVRENSQAAIAWLESLEPGEYRDDGVREAYRSLAPHDREAAIEWVTGTEHERWRDPALALHARHVALGRPEEAIALAEKIIDDTLRETTLTMITRVWVAQDEEAAKEFAENNPNWTEKERARALSIAWRQRAAIMARLEREQDIYPGQILEKMERDLEESDLD